MTPAATKTAPREARYMGPLDIEREVLNYEQFPPLFNYWLGTGSVGGSIVVNDREAVVPGANELGVPPLRAFISGIHLVSGASASLQPDRLIAIAGGQINTGAFTIIPLDADDAPVG